MKILKFTAPWCGQCRVLSKNLKGFDVCEVIEYNVEDDNNQEIVENYSIMSLPTMVLIDENGVEVKRWNGIVNVNDLKSEIESLNE